MKCSSRKLFYFFLCYRKTWGCLWNIQLRKNSRFAKLPSETTQIGLSLPVPTKHTTVLILSTGDYPLLPPDPSARNQSVLIKLIAFIYFTYLNLTWPTWKAQRIIFTSPQGMKHKRNMTFWFGHFPYSALRQVSHDEGKKQSGQEKLSSLQNSNSPLLDKCWLIHSFFTRQKQSSDFVNSKCQQGMAAQLLKRWRMKQGFAAADSSPPSTQT